MEDEIRYLGTYLQLEQLRFKHSFELQCKSRAGSEQRTNIYPRNGIAALCGERDPPWNSEQEKGGKRSAGGIFPAPKVGSGAPLQTMARAGKQYKSIKSSQHIEYQSRVCNSPAERIDVLNMQQKKQIAVEVEDVHDEAGNIAGTRVTVKFPINH